MRKYTPPPKVRKNDKRNADEFIREWCISIGNVCEASRLAGLYYKHLGIWLNEPDRGLSPDTIGKLSRAANIPAEALLFRWTPIGELDMWKWLNQGGKQK
jgi:hypothetical protein